MGAGYSAGKEPSTMGLPQQHRACQCRASQLHSYGALACQYEVGLCQWREGLVRVGRSRRQGGGGGADPAPCAFQRRNTSPNSRFNST
eukprot:3603701-Rhodomonas_salina.2